MKKFILDLNLTLLSGQPPHFVWSREGEKFIRAWNGKIVEVSQNEKGEIISNNKKFCDFTFRAQDDLKKIYKKISTDSFMEKAIKDYYGLRLTQSDVWETTCCFVLSSNNSIPNIRKSTQLLMQKYGEKIESNLYSFPSIESIAKAKESELKKCKVGFRAPYLKHTARQLLENDFSFSKKGDAKCFFLNCLGIGEKISECISLFGYGFLDSFPIDVWVKRAMQQVYFNGRETKNEKIIEKANELWGDLKGYAQQYLFYEFMSKKGKR